MDLPSASIGKESGLGRPPEKEMIFGIRAVIEATKVAEETGDYHGKSPLELTKKELIEYVKKLEKEMKQAASDLQFERAAQLRDQIFEYKVRL